MTEEYAVDLWRVFGKVTVLSIFLWAAPAAFLKWTVTQLSSIDIPQVTDVPLYASHLVFMKTFQLLLSDVNV